MEIEDLIPYIMMLDSNDFQVKGDDNQILIRPSNGIGCQINGMRFDDTRAIIVTQGSTIIYHGEAMIEVTFNELLELIIDGYSWEDIEYDE